jgi:hypothetical protein
MGKLCIFILRLVLVILTGAMLLGLSSPSIFAQDMGEEEVYDAILEVKRDRKTLAKAIFGLEKDYKYYLPIQELSRIVEFKTDVSLKSGTAQGFFFSEENTFRIDVQNNTYTLRGERYNFEPDEAFVFNQKFGIGDIYVTPELLNKIWPLQLDLDNLRQIVDIQTKKKLPYELSLARQAKRDNLLNKADKPTGKIALPRINNDYKLFSFPAIDASATSYIGGEEDGLGQNIYLRGRNDLLNSEASYNINIDKQPDESFELNNARFLLERKSYEEGDLPLDLQLMQLGDVRPRPSRLIDGVLTGRGFLVSSEPTKQVRDFDQIVVEGFAEPGWEVELYRNGELIDFLIVDSSGEYRFENVTLNFSNTIIKTVLYGPEGQVNEIVDSYDISENMLASGKTVYEVSALDLNEDLIPSTEDRGNSPEGLAFNAKVKRGITSWLSAFTSFTRTPTRQDDRNYATAGLNLSFLGVSGLAEAYKDLSGGSAYDFRAATKFLGANINLRASYFSDFESEEANFDGNARTSWTELTISRPIKTFLGNLGFRFQIDNQRFENLPDRTQYDFSQTYAKNKLRLTNGNTFFVTDGDYRTANGRFNATYRFNPTWQLRSLLSYDIHPDWDLKTALGELRYKNGRKFTAAADVTRDFVNKGTRFGANFTYDFEKFKLGINTDWDRDSGVRSFLRLSSSIAPYGKNGEYIFSSDNLSNRTSLNGLVYLDKNYDGQYNAGDELIEDSLLDIGRRETKHSGNDGYARFIGSSKEEYENVTLNMDSLNNPFAVTDVAGYSALLRPATSTHVEFPVIETGYVEGVISTQDGPLSGVRMELISNGKIIENTSTAFDGYYVFEYIRPGSYTVRIDPTYEEINLPPRDVSVTSENLFISNVDFLIIEQTVEVACANDDLTGDEITHDCLYALVQEGMKQSAHTNLEARKNLPTATDVRITQDQNIIRLEIDYDKPPNPYHVIQPLENKEIAVILKNSNWNMKDKWVNEDPNILNRYLVEYLPNGDIKLVLMGVETIRVKDSRLLETSDDNGHGIYFDLKK